MSERAACDSQDSSSRALLNERDRAQVLWLPRRFERDENLLLEGLALRKGTDDLQTPDDGRVGEPAPRILAPADLGLKSVLHDREKDLGSRGFGECSRRFDPDT